MDNIDILLKKKEEQFKIILSLTKDFIFVDNMDTNVSNLNKLYNVRKVNFDILKKIDNNIKNINDSHCLNNSKISLLKNELIALDKYILAEMNSLFDLSKRELKKTRSTKKINNHYKIDIFSNSGYNFSNEA